MGEKTVRDNKILFILLATLITVGVIIFMNYLSFANIQKVITDSLRENQLTETRHVTGRIEHHILQAKDELITWSKFPDIEDLTAEKCQRGISASSERVSNVIDSLLRTDKDGNIIACSSPRFSDFFGLNIKNKEYFTGPRDKKEPFITGIVRQGITPKLIISVPLFESSKYTPYPNFIGEFKGVLLTIIEIEDLYNLYLHPYIGLSQRYFILFDPYTGETILKSGDIGEYATIKPMLPQEEDFNTIAEFDGSDKTIITSSDMILGTKKLKLMILTPLDVVSANMDSLQKSHLFSLIFILIVGIITSIFLVRLYKSKEDIQSRLKKANVTLEKFGINIGMEAKKYADADIPLAIGKIYLIKEEEENYSHELFISTLNRGFAGLGIVRENPSQFKERYNLKKTPFIWMTKVQTEGIPAETDIISLYNLISEFVKKGKKSVILMDRMDYVITENEFEDVIKTIHSLNDAILDKECIIILSVNPELIEKSKLSRIESETIDIYGKHLDKRISLPEKELDILRFINENNVQNKLVTYGDITTKFGITKPTTRVKIQKLGNLGLLKIEQTGRFKSLKITSAGRRIIR